MPQMYQSLVYHGQKLGRTIGFPTVNLDPTVVDQNLERGVYASHVTVGEKTYLGALYFGPRLVLNETKDVLEIHLLDFTGEIYDQILSFTVEKFIRGILNFKSLPELQTQLKADVLSIKS